MRSTADCDIKYVVLASINYLSLQETGLLLAYLLSKVYVCGSFTMPSPPFLGIPVISLC